MWEIIKDYMNSFIGAILLLISLIVIPEIRAKKKYWIPIVILIVILTWLGIDKTNRDKSKDENYKTNDSLKNKRFDSLRISDKKEIIDSFKHLKVYDTTIINKISTNTVVHNKDSSVFYGVPNIEISQFNSNYSPNKDSIFSSIDFTNVSTTDAYNFNWSVTGLLKADKYFAYKKSRDYDNQVLASKGVYYYNSICLNREKTYYDTLYLYITLDYSNYYKKISRNFSKLLVWHFSDKKWDFVQPQERLVIEKMIKEINGGL
jgi:hypothetical protein